MKNPSIRFGLAGKCLVVLLLSLPVAQPALAQSLPQAEAGDVRIKFGPAGVLFNESAEVTIGGAVVPGGNVSLSDNVTVSGEIEYFATPAISAAVIFGLPPTTTITGEGALAPAGKLGKVHYGLGAAVIRYHLLPSRRFSPYIGAGVSHLFVFDEKDGALTNLKVRTAWSPMIEGGAEVRLADRIGLYSSIIYSTMKTRSQGSIFGAPASARVKLRPIVLQAGLFYRM